MRYAQNYCHRSVHNDSVTYTGPCIVTKKMQSVTVPLAGERLYNMGSLIQNAFPGLKKEEREFLISGMSAEGWEQTFSGEDE